MHVFVTVLVIALTTALLAALIVALDWDLAVIDAWHGAFGPQQPVVAWGEPDGAGVDGPLPPRAPRTAPVLVVAAEEDESERWLAAAIAGRLPEYRAAQRDALALHREHEAAA